MSELTELHASTRLQKALITSDWSLSMVSRRSYLTTFAVAGLAGCIGNQPNSTTTTRPAMTIEAAAVQYSYQHVYNHDWGSIQVADGQFVFVTVDASEVESVPNREAFSLVTSDDRHDPITIEDQYPWNLAVPGEAYMSERGDTKPRGWLMFDVPAQLDRDPSLRLESDNDAWEWKVDTKKATAPPPVWDWTASTPETVAPGETFDITVSAENIGDGPGTFRGVVNFSYPVYSAKGFDIVLDPGEADETSISARTRNAGRTSGATYRVRTPSGNSEVSVTIGGESSSTSAE